MVKYFELEAVPIDPSKYDGLPLVICKFACWLSHPNPEAYLQEILDKCGLRQSKLLIDHELRPEPLERSQPELLRSLEQKAHWLVVVVPQKE